MVVWAAPVVVNGETGEFDGERLRLSTMAIYSLAFFVFWAVIAAAGALSHLLRAIEVDFADVLAKKNATVSVRQIIRELEAAQEPLWSPMVLNGSGAAARLSAVSTRFRSRPLHP